jgi:hypothetical protein
VLGFEVHQNDDEPGVIHAVSGKAHIRFGAHDYSPNDWDRPRPVGSTIVFFETDNVESIHAAVRARGGKPSENCQAGRSDLDEPRLDFSFRNFARGPKDMLNAYIGAVTVLEFKTGRGSEVGGAMGPARLFFHDRSLVLR